MVELNDLTDVIRRNNELILALVVILLVVILYKVMVKKEGMGTDAAGLQLGSIQRSDAGFSSTENVPAYYALNQVQVAKQVADQQIMKNMNMDSKAKEGLAHAPGTPNLWSLGDQQMVTDYQNANSREGLVLRRDLAFDGRHKFDSQNVLNALALK